MEGGLEAAQEGNRKEVRDLAQEDRPEKMKWECSSEGCERCSEGKTHRTQGSVG